MRIAVTGMGLVTALGWGAEASWAAIRAGRSGVRPIARFDTTGLRTRIAARPRAPGAESPPSRHASTRYISGNSPK